ncbi:CLUMA_CG015221, isoform A [Clunio marinus]|uniref:CLUMA_CG015221, isoform A n=1 Tax=Clunio marinus TaxID=568069 RepID=A0A1J1IQE6_9DIPT|nr:CLUMA_CG015221, isoform A [Clunio marinus]
MASEQPNVEEELNKSFQDDILIPPLRNTMSLQISPDQTKICDIARKQLDNLSSVKSKRKLTSNSDTEAAISPTTPIKTDLVHDSKQIMHNLSSAIVSKAELENEIRKKVAKQEPFRKPGTGTIEIPQEVILSGLNSTPISKTESEETQLHDQELIDILEGKSEEGGEIFEVVAQEGKVMVVKENKDNSSETTSYEIVTGDSEVSQAKTKLLEREIAMRQIASLPMRKNKRRDTSTGSAKTSSNSSIAQTLAAEWDDDDKNEMILEVLNVEEDGSEPKIKILNMTIVNEPEVKTKVQSPKSEPKILNKEAPKNAPKILNINASSAETPASFKRSRVVKKREIWDPSQTKTSPIAVEKKPIEKLPLSLPPSITIKKLTKENITKGQLPTEPDKKPGAKKGKKRSNEIDKLLQDEGAVNMIYSLERENNNEDVPEIEVKSDEGLIDKSQEKSSLVTKAKAIRNVVIKQSSSPQETKAPVRVRVKRDATPSKTVEQQESQVATVKAQKSSTAANRKKKADNTWDYIFSQAQASCDDAMIIRRRSNSSYSSSAASPRRLSVDINESFDSPPSSAKKSKQETFEFTNPPQKIAKSPADKVFSKDFVEELRGKISNVITKNKEKPQTTAQSGGGRGRKRTATTQNDSNPTSAKRASRSNGVEHKEIRLEKHGKVAHVILNQNPLTLSLLSEMKTVLNQLESDESQVVLITSSEGFSEGIDYSTLVQTTVDKRKQAASDLVTAIKNFFISLAAFPKILVCGLKGVTSGAGVSMLPLFDLVFAEPSSTFSIPHARIGSNPEGISILQFSGKVKSTAINEMFYLNATLDANEACSNGLITRIISKNFDNELMSHCERIAEFSSQTLESTKSILNEDFLNSIDGYLATEVKILQQQWISAECQEKFKKHNVKGEW